MILRALRSLGIFACHCEVQPDLIRVGMLVVDPDEESLEPGVYTLVDVDKEEAEVLVGYPVEIPELAVNPSYDVVLKRCLTNPNPNLT